MYSGLADAHSCFLSRSSTQAITPCLVSLVKAKCAGPKYQLKADQAMFNELRNQIGKREKDTRKQEDPVEKLAQTAGYVPTGASFDYKSLTDFCTNQLASEVGTKKGENILCFVSENDCVQPEPIRYAD